MKLFTFCFLLLCSKALTAQTLNGPESVDCDTLTNTWYVGNTGSGKILRLAPGGTWANFISNLPSGPYGIEVVNDRIYACSGAFIRGYNLSDGAQVFSVNTGATFLNGLTHDDAGHLFATDFSTKRIYKIDLASATSWIYVAATTTTPNGILFDKPENRLVFASWGGSAKIMGVSLADSTVAVLKTTTFSNIDGIAMDKQGRYYVAHWGGNAVHRYNHDFLQAPVSITTGLSSPADIYYNIQTDTLAIPNSGNNTVKFIGFAPVSAVTTVTTPISIALYPNPASNILLISTEQPDKTLEILYISDYSGRQVQCPTEKSGNQYQITVKDLPSGIYTVTVRVGDQEQVLRFVR